MLEAAVVASLVWDVVALVLVAVVGLMAVVATVGGPVYVAYTAYQTAATNDLANPAALGFAAGFFALLIVLFIGMLILTYAA